MGEHGLLNGCRRRLLAMAFAYKKLHFKDWVWVEDDFFKNKELMEQ
jgi:hypothetical protein